MTQEEKQLLLVDLCGRLPYGVKVQAYSYEHDVETIETLYGIDSDGYISTLECGTLNHISKPYLFPMSSMTEKQKRELEDMGWSFDDSVINNIVEYLGKHRQFVTHFDCFALMGWLNAHHFDYRGLIPIGLAIDATGLNIY